MDFGMPMMSVHELIEMINSDDIMFQYQGVMQLREMLSYSDEKQLGGFPLEKACKKLIEILGQPVVSEFSHEIKCKSIFCLTSLVFAIQCLHTLMDIYPTHIPTLISQNLIENLTEAMEAASAFGLEDMNRVCIKVIEQITMENPRAIVSHGKALVLCVNIIDFLDTGLQKRVLKILHNVAHHANSEDQFNSALVPTLPVLCQMLQLNCEEDVEKSERVSVILKRMTDSFTRFQSPIEKFDRVGATFEHFSTIGVVEVMVKGLEDFAVSESAKSKKTQQNSGQQEDQVMSQQNISTFAVNKRTHNHATISNFLRILSVACKYSQQIVMQLISGGLLDILEELLPDQDAEIAVYTQDVLSLLENLFPATESKDGEFTLSGSHLQLGADQTLHPDAVNQDPRNEQYKEAVKTLEAEKRAFFLGFEVDVQTRFMSKLLPKIFSVYKMNLQTTIRTRCLNLIDKILHVVKSELISTSIDPIQFAQFVEIIFLSGNGQQVLLSLRTIKRVLETQQLCFSVQFIRQGISQFVTQLQEAKNATHYDVEVKPLDPFAGGASNFLPRQFSNEKETLVQRIKEIQTIIQMSGEELNQDQKTDLEQILQDRMNALISLKAKERMVAEVQASQLEKEKKIKDQKQETKEEKLETTKLSDVISKEAQNLAKLYFNNGDYITKVKQQFPEEIQVLQQQKKLSQALMDESIQQQFDAEKTQKLMQELATLITSSHGITNYEFTESGLLKALQQFLTVPPSQSYKDIFAEEEFKQGDTSSKFTRDKLTKKDSESIILRLKVFAHVMCHQLAPNQMPKLPFFALIAQCHSVLSVNEPILFSKDTKDGSQNTVDALRQLSRHCVINLVYDPDRKQIDKERLKAKQTPLSPTETDPLKLALADNNEMIEEEDETKLGESPQLDRKAKSSMPFEHLSAASKEEKSLIYYRRHKLFTELSQVPLNIQQRDNIWLLEDFLLKRLKTSDDVKKLVAHTRPAYSSGLFKTGFQHEPKERDELEEIEKYELQEMYARCLEKVDYVISNAQDSAEFNLMMPDVIKELADLIQEHTKKFNFTEEELELMFKHLARDTEDLIREQELGQGSGEEDQDLIDRDASEIAYYIQVKIMDFLKMIEKLRELTFDKTKTKPFDDQIMAEETKDQKKSVQPLTKILPTEIPRVESQQQSVNSISEYSDSASLQKLEASKPNEQSLSISQNSDIEMTDEQNLQSISQTSEDKPLDEAMQEEVDIIENKMQDLVALMPGKLTKSKMDDPMDMFVKNQKLMEEKIQKFKQQHIMQQIAPDKALVLEAGQSQDEDFMKLDIDELIRMNQGEDIDIEFYFNGKRLELNTSFYEIIKAAEDPLLDLGADKKLKPKNAADHIREVLANLSGGGQGFSLPNYHTIHFLIKDKPKSQIKDRKDSIADVAYRIQRSKSQVHEEISMNSVNMLVQELIENEFQVLPPKNADKTDKKDERNLKNIEHSLKILKVLHFVHKNPSLLTEQGINFLLHKSVMDQQLKKLAYDDMELMNVAQHQVKVLSFRHAKIDDNMIKSIQNPYKLVQDGLSDILKNIFQSCPFLFDFETKLLYFKLVSFIGIDINRSLFFLQNYLSQKGLLGKATDENAGGAMGFFMRDRDDPNRNKIRKQLFTIDRQKVLDEAFRICPQLQKRSLLEIQYHNEVGTGLGPTLEFYTLLAEELVKAENDSLWLKTGTNYLFPKALAVTPSNLEKTRKSCSLFQLAGSFVAKSIVDDRLIDIPISPLMWDLIIGKKMNLFDLKRLNQLYFNTFSQLQNLANRKREIDAMLGLDFDSRKRLIGSIKTQVSIAQTDPVQNGATVEDFDLYFVCPTDPTIELIKDGQEEKVTLENLQDYIDLSLHFIFHETVNLQIKAFKKGFSQILPIESLRPFNSEEELENLICGQLNDAEWTNFDRLLEVIIPDHGFDRTSRVFRDFIRFLTEVKQEDRPQLMKFLSGSKRMHAGGFAALNPRLTVVLKKVEGISNAAPDLHLPSVSTCAKYLKIPGYSSYEVLKTKFNLAIWEGADNFTLS